MNAAEHIALNIEMPDPAYEGHWDAIVVEPDLKTRLINHAVLALTVRPKLRFETAALHGLIALLGPAGTGKTTLARGLGYKLSEVGSGSSVRFIEIHPHGLMSHEHGRSQQAVQELLVDHLPALAADGKPTLALIDEIESMAVARSAASLEANPVDVHRATDAVLTALDTLTREAPQIVFVVTSNFPETLDSAFLSRADAIINVPLPGPDAILEILRSTISAFGAHYSRLESLAAASDLDAVARRCRGLDGRQVRKLVSQALAMRLETALDPEKLAVTDLMRAAEFAAGDQQQELRAHAL